MMSGQVEFSSCTHNAFNTINVSVDFFFKLTLINFMLYCRWEDTMILEILKFQYILMTEDYRFKKKQQKNIKCIIMK